jgi:hypothetical protein
MATTVRTPTCIICGVASLVVVDEEKFKNGAHVQDAFPRMPAMIREMFITGTHPDCWDEMFGKDDGG